MHAQPMTEPLPPGLIMDPSGNYRIDLKVTGAPPMRRSLKTTDLAQARKAYLEIVADAPPADPSKVTTAEAVEVFLRRLAASRPTETHFAAKRRVLEGVTSHVHRLLGRVTFEQILGAQETLTAGKKASSARNVGYAIKGFFKWCVTRGWLRVSPAAELYLPRQDRDPRDITRMVPLSVVEAMTFPTAQSGWRSEMYQAMVRSAWATAMRPNELSRVRLSHIDPERMRLFIPKSKTRESRKIPIADGATMEAVLRLAAYVEADRITHNRGTWPGILAREARRLGVDPFTPYALRHSRITIWVNVDRVNIKRVMRWAGHTTLEHTAAYLWDDDDGHIPLTGLKPITEVRRG